MIAKLILDKKREGHALTTTEIRDFINGFVRGEVPDYQMSALAMAICCRGMNERETADLTLAMMNSGRCLTWDVKTADKHSTGGVGDKLSLIIQPLAASCGVYVPSLTGRGLGLTGGTADKLETIPGYNASLSLEDFQRVVAEAGVAMALQTNEITPADKKLYALRDVTGTVASIPLITGSILSKKLAEGSDTLVFDVKCGSGTFMKTLDDAKALAASLVSGARAAGRKVAALVTDMNAPLGYAVGNANEVCEALAILENRDPDHYKVVTDLCVEFAATMVSLELSLTLDEARTTCRAHLADGSALAKFKAMVKGHGGDLDAFAARCKEPTSKFCIQAMQSGYITAIDAEHVARVAFELGAGREKAGDAIDPLAGVTLAVKRGDRVAVGAPLATLETTTRPDMLEKTAAEMLKAFTFSPEAPAPASLIFERIS